MDINKEMNDIKSQIMERYNKNDEISTNIVNRLFEAYLNTLKSDIRDLPFTDFYKKYINGMSVFQASDFTKSEIEIIISETPLTERDRAIAKLYFLELRSEEYIADKLLIDKKTVRSNITKIRGYLNSTCVKIYGKN